MLPTFGLKENVSGNDGDSLDEDSASPLDTGVYRVLSSHSGISISLAAIEEKESVMKRKAMLVGL